MEALYKGCPIRPDLLTNMSTTAIVVADWLISKIYTQPIEPLVLYIILYYMYMYANVPPYLSEFFKKIFKK